MMSAHLYLVGGRKSRLTFKAFKSIQRDSKEDAVFSVVIPTGFKYFLISYCCFSPLTFFSLQFFISSCSYLCWLILRPIFLFSFLIKCVAVKFGYPLQRGKLLAPGTGVSYRRDKNFDVTLKILVISLDSSCIHHSSNLKSTRKSVLQRNGISQGCPGRISLDIPQNPKKPLYTMGMDIFIYIYKMAVAVSSGFLRFWSECEIPRVYVYASWQFNREWFDHQDFVVFRWNIYSQITAETFYLSMYFLPSPCSVYVL